MTPCVLHVGATVGIGYGLKSYKGRLYRAHRLAYALHRGLDPQTMGGTILHTCDVPACINPDHLVMGTQAQNVADMVGKGRQAKGPGHGKALFTAEQVADIRARYVRGCRANGCRDIARDLRVDATVISELTRGLTY